MKVYSGGSGADNLVDLENASTEYRHYVHTPRHIGDYQRGLGFS